MKTSSCKSVGVRVSPYTGHMLRSVAKDTGHTPSTIAFMLIDGILPALDDIRSSYEKGKLPIARWLDKLIIWGGYKKARASANESFIVWLPAEVVARLDAIAPRFYMSRCRLVALILDSAAKVFPVMGQYSLSVLLRFLAGISKDLELS